MFNWNDIRVLLEVVRAGSISGAAATLKVDASTVSRRIQALEKELGTRCFERTSGRLHLRAECAAILTQAQLMESAAAEIERAMHPEFSPAAGVVRVATTRTMASKVVLPAIDAIAQSDPHVTVEVDTQVQRINLIRGEAEIALTPYAVTHPRLIRRLVFEASGALYGSREYFDGRRPPTPGSFDGHRLLGMAEVNAATPAGAWWDENIHGGEVVLRSSSAEELLRLCCEGRGLAADPHEQTDLAPQHPIAVRYLRGLLGQTLAEVERPAVTREHEAARTEIDADTRAQLEALGYAGASRAPTEEDAE